jgi:hypothetical protein
MIWSTTWTARVCPEDLVEHHHTRKEKVGDYEMLANFSFGGLPYELVYEQLKAVRRQAHAGPQGLALKLTEVVDSLSS